LQAVVGVLRLAFDFHGGGGAKGKALPTPSLPASGEGVDSSPASGGGREGQSKFQPRVGPQGAEERVRHQEQILRLEQGPVLVALHQPVPALGVAPEILHRRLDVAVQHQGRVIPQVVEQGGACLEEQGQVVLHAAGGQLVGNVLVELALGRVALEAVAEALAEVGDAVVVQGHLPGRQQADFRHLVEGALGIRVEGADGFDLVVEQVDAEGERGPHGIQVDDAAAHREFAGLSTWFTAW
jgi:hypothetical protein